MENLRIGVDIGGTNIAAAIVNEKGEILAKVSNPTMAELGQEKSIEVIKETIKELVSKGRYPQTSYKGIGIGVPGVCDVKNGIVKFAPNLFWDNVNIVEILNKEFKLPIYIDNDANAAAVGEAWCGAGKNKNNIVCITIGTGVGCGLVLNGKIFHGTGNGAGEIGHITVLEDGPVCNCGNPGCLEALVAAPAIAKQGRKAAAQQEETLLKKIANINSITAKDVFDAAKQGDKVSLDIVDDMARFLGIALANTINLLNPEQIVIGGGVAAAGDVLFNPLKKVVSQRAIKTLYSDVEIVPAVLGNDAGIIGAAALVV